MPQKFSCRRRGLGPNRGDLFRDQGVRGLFRGLYFQALRDGEDDPSAHFTCIGIQCFEFGGVAKP